MKRSSMRLTATVLAFLLAVSPAISSAAYAQEETPQTESEAETELESETETEAETDLQAETEEAAEEAETEAETEAEMQETEEISSETITLEESAAVAAAASATYSALTLDVETTVSIDSDGEAAIYTFTPTETADYKIWTTGDYDTHIFVYDEDGDLVAFDDDSGDDWNALVKAALTAGTTYEIWFTAYDGTATFTAMISQVSDSEIPVSAVLNLVSSIVLYEGVNSYTSYTNYNDESTAYEYYYLSGFTEGDQVIVTMKDGSTVVYTYAEDEYGFSGFEDEDGNSLGYYIMSDQYDSHWEVGGTYAFTMQLEEYDDYDLSVSVPVTIEANPYEGATLTYTSVSGASYTTITYTELVACYDGYNDEDGYYVYYLVDLYLFSEGDTLTVTLADGTQTVYTAALSSNGYYYIFTDSDGDSRYVNIDKVYVSETELAVGDTFTVEITLTSTGGLSCDLSVIVVFTATGTATVTDETLAILLAAYQEAQAAVDALEAEADAESMAAYAAYIAASEALDDASDACDAAYKAYDEALSAFYDVYDGSFYSVYTGGVSYDSLSAEAQAAYDALVPLYNAYEDASDAVEAAYAAWYALYCDDDVMEVVQAYEAALEALEIAEAEYTRALALSTGSSGSSGTSGTSSTSSSSSSSGSSTSASSSSTSSTSSITVDTASYTLESSDTSSAVITIDYDYSKFVSVAVDGTTLVSGTDYTVSQGSTIITFSESYLETLDEGTHEVVVTFSDAEVTTTLTIYTTTSSSDSDTDTAETGDEAMPLMYALVMLAALAGCAAVTFTRRRRA